jgi:RNA polymerase sigma factor (sigma-70 family)
VHVHLHADAGGVAVTEAVREAVDGPGDAVLIAAVRRGDTAAYGVLYERHLAAARRAAVSLAATTAEREDLVAEAFTRVLRVLRAGYGPTEAFRAYLFVTMRNVACTATRRGVELALYADVPDAASVDELGHRLHGNLAADAFASLPERWRMVLWHTQVEGESPAAIAPLFGMTPNSVAALAYRAREGLRQAYLEQYLPTVPRRDCRAIAAQLAGWVRHGFSAHKMRRIAAHLDQCADCRELADDLAKINDGLRGLLAPILLGAPLAAAYTSAAASSITSSGAVLAAATKAGIPTLSWLTALKTVAAGAAIVTTTAVSMVAAEPPSAPVSSDNGGVAVSIPRQPPAAGPHAPARPVSDSPVLDTAPHEPGADPNVGVAPEGKPAKAAAKAAEKAEKAEKQATKDARAEAKAAKKEAKADAKAAKENKKAK